MAKNTVLGSAGETEYLLGNEAIARGVIEGGVKVASAYPGTPSSEVVDTLSEVGKEVGMHVEWSSNEHVAIEVAMGAAQSNVRAFCAMKHNGLSVAYDMFTHMSIRDITGGLVVNVADDPDLAASQTAHDTRWLARCAGIPVIEPSNPQEAKDFTKSALEFSEEIKLPIMLRTVTNVSHMRGNVVLDEVENIEDNPKFDFEKQSLSRLMEKGDLPIPFFQPGLYETLHEKEKSVRKIFEKFEGNEISGEGSELGIIASGVSYNYVLEAIDKLDLKGKVKVLKLTTPYPIPNETVSSFLKENENMLVVEELEPYIETQVKALAKDANPDITIYGKESDHIPREGELTTEIVTNALSSIFGRSKYYESQESSEVPFSRMLTMCEGCPHRAMGYALKQEMSGLGENRVIVDNDIGCYILLMAPPYNLDDMSFCMGTSASVPQGRYHAGVDQELVGIIGDSTFIHAGIPGLINAVYNKADVNLIIADNRATAMTGFQPHPGTGKTAMGEETKMVSLKDIVKACGVESLQVVDPYDIEETRSAFKEMFQFDGPSVVISKRSCALEAARGMKKRGLEPTIYSIDPEICTGCRTCTERLGCPAINWKEEKEIAEIIPERCAVDCDVCAQICPVGAISEREKE